MYTVELMNIDRIEIYNGKFLDEAATKAVRSGYECAVYKNGVLYSTYSPIYGWRR